VIEAAAAGTPSVVIAGADNAATELVEEGVNGFVAPDASPEVVADAIVRVHAGGADLRDSTAAWFQQNAQRLTAASSARTVAQIYASAQRQGAGVTSRSAAASPSAGPP
jgi:glycosyltransferase involved in cell wall biosynthesis